MKVKKQHFFTLLATFLLAFSCAEHNLETPASACNSGQVSFSQQVAPIMQGSCALSGCHNGDLGDPLNWTNFDRVKAKASSVKDRVTRPVGTAGHMPKSGSLSQSQIQLIVCWVDQGALNN